MRHAFRALVLSAAVAALVGSGELPTAPALQKEKDKEKKADDKKADEVGKVEVYKAKDGWRFRIKNADGKSVAISTSGHEKKEEVIKDLEFLKTTLAKAKIEEGK